MVDNFWQETARICKFYKFKPLFMSGGFFHAQPLTLPRPEDLEDRHILIATHKDLVIADGNLVVKFIRDDEYHDDTYDTDITVYDWIEMEHVYVQNNTQVNVKNFSYYADMYGRDLQESAERCGKMLYALFEYWKTVKLAEVPNLNNDKVLLKYHKPEED